ncbi:EAL domain-containing protein [Alteromonas sp. H39]|uniref:EAL domain-containing protein n=1 Tax=Alteromonas sp. H39 TaxID=3389876 RepID=UPI0039DFB3B9
MHRNASTDKSSDLLFRFKDDEAVNADNQGNDGWTLLSVEDDKGYQNSLVLALSGITVQGRKLNILTAESASEAASILAERDDIGVILLDVVMEKDDAGLYLVNTIRNILGNDRIRVILLTGQPGIAPRKDVMKDYDIDEYWNKVDLTEEKLRTLVTSNFRTYISLTELYIAKRGLQMIVDASRSITGKQEINAFTHTVLDEVGKVIGTSETGGIVCVYRPDNATLAHCPVVATSGDFSNVQANSLAAFLELDAMEEASPQLIHTINRALELKEHQFFDGWSVLYFSTAKVDSQHYLIIVRSRLKLESSHITLLMVFSENIANGFTNLALLNKLSTLAYFDNTLHIPNRNWVIRELQNMTSSERQRSLMILVDVQNFTETEITLGSEYTKSLLEALLASLRHQFPLVYAIALTGDDSFALLFHKKNRPSQSELAELSEQSLTINGLEHSLLLNVCVVDLALLDGLPPEQYLTVGEMALTTGRDRGEQVSIFSKDFPTEVESRYKLLRELHQAISDQEGLELAFQPKLNMRTNETVGLEALIRWRKSDGTMVPPIQFIPLAEASGLMAKIDAMVMNKTFAAAQVLQDEGVLVPISFNVNYSDITNKLFIDNLKQLVEEQRVPASMIEIELTESQAMEDYNEVNPILDKLLDMGVKVNIDDFGTGYSSLAHITELAATTLKVDQSFVAQLTGTDPSAATAVCDMVRRLGERFNFELIAEGVENEEQKQILLRNGYQYGQGYYFAKPMFLSDCIAWLKR